MKTSAVKNNLSLHPFLDDDRLAVATASSQATISPTKDDQEPAGETVQMWISTTDNGTGIIHPLSVTALSLLWGCRGFFCWSQSQLSLGEGRVFPGQVASSSQGPSLMAEAAMQGVSRTSGAIWGSVSCSRTLRHAAQLSPELGFEANLT